ncbi:MAG: hypothetical protein ACOXZK_10535 [Bacteroidales bacterium]
MITSVIINLGILFYFKYAYFFTDIYNQIMQTDIEVFQLHCPLGKMKLVASSFRVDQILLPVGISFLHIPNY